MGLPNGVLLCFVSYCVLLIALFSDFDDHSMIVQWQASPLEFLPVKVFVASSMFYHCNAIIYRANNLAQIAAYTFIVLDGIRVIRFSV